MVYLQPGLPLEAQEGQSHLASGLSLPALSLQSKEGSAMRRWVRCHPHLRSSAKALRFYLLSMAGEILTESVLVFPEKHGERQE